MNSFTLSIPSLSSSKSFSRLSTSSSAKARFVFSFGDTISLSSLPSKNLHQGRRNIEKDLWTNDEPDIWTDLQTRRCWNHAVWNSTEPGPSLRRHHWRRARPGAPSHAFKANIKKKKKKKEREKEQGKTFQHKRRTWRRRQKSEVTLHGFLLHDPLWPLQWWPGQTAEIQQWQEQERISEKQTSPCSKKKSSRLSAT